MNNSSSPYELMGGAETIHRLVHAFYPRVVENELLAPLFQRDIAPVMEKQIQFLTQFFGGPSLFSDQHGHPMMRARHLPFPITTEHAAAWLDCMDGAAQEIGMPEDLRTFVINRLSGPAYHFVNTDLEGRNE
ncbi:globin [Paenibacillus pasadenensis]|uniref:globin domain-containing protein n=1 Tax=Paenibacillus pasadenensis TaxID=217090 RepID=UPI00203A5164|nr:globin [Paenibacillus pasadenensis]MCM3749696.1 globin [Paenibacillus pasadenensis]